VGTVVRIVASIVTTTGSMGTPSPDAGREHEIGREHDGRGAALRCDSIAVSRTSYRTRTASFDRVFSAFMLHNLALVAQRCPAGR
jgi:hypothetical protein